MALTLARMSALKLTTPVRRLRTLRSPGVEDVVGLREPRVVRGLDLAQQLGGLGVELAERVAAADVGAEQVEVAPVGAGEEPGAQEAVVLDVQLRALLREGLEVDAAAVPPVDERSNPQRVVAPVLVRGLLAPHVPVQAHPPELVVP